MKTTLRSIVCAAVVVVFAAAAGAQTAAENKEDAERLVAALHVASGQTVCEIGAGSGELSVQLARTVGKDGRVYSNDLNAGRRAEIATAARTLGVDNVTVVEGRPESANLEPGVCDALFMRNVYHHFATPATMDASLFASVKPGGYIAVLDFTPRGTESADPRGRADEAHHGVSPASVIRELGEAGFASLAAAPTRGGGFMVVGARPPTVK